MQDTNCVQRCVAVMIGILCFGLAAPLVGQTLLLELEKSDGTKVMQVNEDGGLLALGALNVGVLPATGTGVRLMWWPGRAAFRAGRAFVDEWDASNIGEGSAAMGIGTTASGTGSTAMGYVTIASGGSATAMGVDAFAYGDASTAMGNLTRALGDASVAMGHDVTASGDYSVAMGHATDASGDYSVAMGRSTEAAGVASTAVGHQATAQAYGSLALGQYNVVEGSQTSWLAADPVLVVGNGSSDADRSNALTLLKNGDLTVAGNLTVAGRLATGNSTASGSYSTALGFNTEAVGTHSTAMGRITTATGFGSTAIGSGVTASGGYSTAMGNGSTASGDLSTAMGIGGTTASGYGSMAIGLGATASGIYSLAMGHSNTASGTETTAMGLSTTAQAHASVTFGRYNVVEGSMTSWVATDPLLAVGNGIFSARSNAMTLYKNGNLTIAGTLTENSDARLKEDVQPLADVLPRLTGIRGVTFNWKDEQTHPAGQQVGLLAQEVQQAFPELVHEDSEGNLSVAYGNFTAVLLEAIKEQQRENEQLSTRIAELEAAMARLEAAVSGIER